MKQLAKGLIGVAIIANSMFALANSNDKKPDVITNKNTIYLSSFADILEPLMPAVVNVYTSKYNKQPGNKSGSFKDLLPFGHFNNFLEQFNIPFSFDEFYSSPRAYSLGSGFIIDENGYIVTNHHVIEGSDEIHIKLMDGQELPAKIIGTDPKTDLALLKIESDKNLPFVQFGNANNSRVGDIVIAIGNPLGFGGTVTTGIISSKGRDLAVSQDELVDDFLQTDAAINIGSSGGPLFDINGLVIGVNTSIPAVGDGTNIGIGFAIPSETAQDIITQLKERGKINRGRLDIMIQEITDELAEAFGLDSSYGVLVTSVKQGGVGNKAGLQRGDLIIEYNGKKVLNSRKLRLFVADTHVDSDVEIAVMRGKEKLKLKATIIAAEEKETKIVEEQLESIEKSGVIFSSISTNISSGDKSNNNSSGVIITHINPDSGITDLKVGDLVVSIDQNSVKNIEQFSTEYDKIRSQNKKSAVLLIKRRDFTQFAVLPIK